MRSTFCLLLVLGCVNAQPIQAQTQDGPWQRFSNLMTKGRFDVVKTDTRAQAAEPRFSTPTGSFETRGVVYVEEMRGPATPPKLVPAPRAPLTLPQPTPAAIRPQPLPAVSSPIRLVSTTEPTATKDDLLVQRLTRQVTEVCPLARNVKLSFKSAKEVTVELDVRTMEQASACADHIFAIRDLDSYRVNLKFNVPQS